MPRILLLFVVVAALCAVSLPASAVQTWEVYTDFGLTNPSGAWSYGYSVTLGSAFTAFDYTSGSLASGAVWTRSMGGTPNYSPYMWYNPGAVGTYPATSLVYSSGDPGQDEYTVCRWTAPATGKYTVQASFKQMQGTTVPSQWNGRMDNHVLVNGTSVFDCVVNGLAGDITEGPGPFTFTGSYVVPAGGTIDFTGGTFNGSVASDFTDVTGCGVASVDTATFIYGAVTANALGHPPLAGVTVEIVSESLSATTSATGLYGMEVPAGTYTVRASAPLFETKEVTGVVVEEGVGTELNIELRPLDGVTYYVNASTGNDNNDGLTTATAWQSIDAGEKKDIVGAGDTINVAPGTYVPADSNGIVLTHSGGVVQKVIYRKDPAAGSGKVTIDMSSVPPDPTYGTKTGIQISAERVWVDGFEVIGASWGILVYNNNIEISNCEIHGVRPGQPTLTTDTRRVNLASHCAGIFNVVATNVSVHNNLIYDVGYPTLSNIAACIASPSCTGIKIYNNTLADAHSGIATWNNQDSAIEFKNNIVTGMRGFGIDPNYAWADANGALTRTNNIYFANSRDFGWADATMGAGEYDCNPKLTAGYTLDTGSPAINAGVDVGLVFQGSNPDIGAFETASTVAAPDAILQGTVTANVTGHPAITRATISVGGVTLGAADLQGKYKIPVVAGTYSLTAARGGFTSKSASVTVAALGTGTRDFDLNKGTGSTWYVNASSGDDSNNGQTPSTAWATIDRGDVLGVVNPGDTVMIAAGSYPQTAAPGAFMGVRLSKCSGEVAAPITYKADGVVTIDQSSSKADDQDSIGIFIDADNIVLGQADASGQFSIANCQFGVVVAYVRSGNTVANCFIHEMLQPIVGGAGYLAQAAGVYSAGSIGTTIRNNVIFYVGDISAVDDPTAGVILSGCADAKVYNNTMQILQRGVYVVDGSTGIIVRNNIFEYFFVCGIYGGVLPVELTHSNNFFFGDTGTSPPNCAGSCTPGMMEFSTGDTALDYDFTLFSGSPAINMGVDVGLPFNGPAPDLGAYETTDTNYPSGLSVLKGTVRYRSSGLPVEGATVSVMGQSISQLTSADGAYGFIMIPGTYTVQALKEGYAPKWVDNLVLPSAAAVTQDFYLSPGTGGVWDAVEDFSITNPPTGAWKYMQSDTLSSTAAILLPDSTDWGNPAGVLGWWNAVTNVPLILCNPADTQQSTNPPHTLYMHPGPGGDGGLTYGILRWTAPADGMYQVYVNFGASWFTTQTVDCHVLVTSPEDTDGVEFFGGILIGSTGGFLHYADRVQLTAGTTVDAFVGPNGAYYSDTTPVSFTLIGVDTTPANVATIGEAKAYADNKLVAVTTAQIVTVGTGTFVDGSCYIEDAERTTGIKVVLDGPSSIAQGQKITFQGYMGTDDNGERFIRITSLTPQGTGSVGSLGMTNKAIGAGKTGLLVRVWGTVTETDPLGTFVILDDGSGNAIKVLKDASITKAMNVTKMVGVTGPVSLVADGPTMTTVVRARSNDDVVAYN